MQISQSYMSLLKRSYKSNMDSTQPQICVRTQVYADETTIC